MRNKEINSQRAELLVRHSYILPAEEQIERERERERERESVSVCVCVRERERERERENKWYRQE